jgi:hypothetical protein
MNHVVDTKPPSAKTNGKATVAAMVLYEDHSTRHRAMAACDDMVKRFWFDVHFNFDWWHVNFLEEESFAEIAAQSAAKADMVIFSGSADKELATAAKRWFERWSRHRDKRDGALVDLTETTNSLNGAAELKKIYLRDIAGRAFMDYLCKPPAAIRSAPRNGRSTFF